MQPKINTIEAETDVTYLISYGDLLNAIVGLVCSLFSGAFAVFALIQTDRLNKLQIIELENQKRINALSKISFHWLDKIKFVDKCMGAYHTENTLIFSHVNISNNVPCTVSKIVLAEIHLCAEQETVRDSFYINKIKISLLENNYNFVLNDHSEKAEKTSKIYSFDKSDNCIVPILLCFLAKESMNMDNGYDDFFKDVNRCSYYLKKPFFSSSDVKVRVEICLVGGNDGVFEQIMYYEQKSSYDMEYNDSDNSSCLCLLEVKKCINKGIILIG